MKIILDERETRLFHLVQEKCHELSFDISIEKKVLTLGDIHFVNDEEKEVLIIERKSLTDLIASIKDGRYEEQSYRLINSSGMYRSHIVYLIEGGLSQLMNPVEKKMVYSAMNTLQFIKGFSLVKTTSINETAEWICFNANKLKKHIGKGLYPWTPESQSGGEVANYCSVVKKTKKDNITPENIGEILLCQIPGISSVSAISIMKKFQTISNLIDCVKTDPTCLDNIICETKGKQRKLGKNVVQNIIKYLI
jgi:ERCC4-type nuclease|tara:strand:- start:137 stop:889 length:753 start_codon:yes stop_codon:yes gene_type:complete